MSEELDADPAPPRLEPPSAPRARRASHRRRRQVRSWFGLLLVLVVGAAMGAALTTVVDSDHDSTGAGASRLPGQSASLPGVTSTQSGAGGPSGSVGSAASVTSFGAGTYIVGRDVIAATYRSDRGDATCAWARLRADNTIELGHGQGQPMTITLAVTDKALEIQGKCRFVRVQ